jgi:hypothetical protein
VFIKICYEYLILNQECVMTVFSALRIYIYNSNQTISTYLYWKNVNFGKILMLNSNVNENVFVH